MKRLWLNFKNFCSRNWFGVTCVAIGLAAFVAVTAVVIFFPPALPAILAWAPFGGVQLFGFLAATAAVSIPAAAAAFAAICTAAGLVAGGLFRGMVGLFNTITESAHEDIEQRNLQFAKNEQELEVLDPRQITALQSLVRREPESQNRENHENLEVEKHKKRKGHGQHNRSGERAPRNHPSPIGGRTEQPAPVVTPSTVLPDAPQGVSF